MGVDLSGGLDESREFVLPERPDDPEMRESVNSWIWDAGDVVGLPRIGVEAVGETWDAHEIHMNIAYGDGRVVVLNTRGTTGDPSGADGRPRVLSAGQMAFELVEPFQHWRVRIDAVGRASTNAEQIAGRRPKGEPDVPVQAEIDIRAAVPPWENGALLAEARRVLEEQDEGALMGGPRYEQLSRATGFLRVGDAEHRIDGGALRVRRQGVRRLGTFRGHAWQSALFPSGRGFGYIAYPPREDGLPTYNEGYVFDGDEVIPAWVVDAPWLRRLQHRGEDVSVVLETERGTTVSVRGESLLCCISVMGGVGSGSEGYPVLQQAIVRYSWDGETANGMMERSIPGDRIET